MLTAGTGSLKRDGHVLIHVRGLVLADQLPVPPALQGTNPIPDFDAIVSCRLSQAALGPVRTPGRRGTCGPGR